MTDWLSLFQTTQTAAAVVSDGMEPCMGSDDPRVRRIVETVDQLLKKADARRKEIVLEIRATDKQLRTLEERRRTCNRQ